MRRENQKRSRSIRKLVMISSFTAIILIVSTYAWFIGMRTVNVTSFDVEIAAAESLWLSLDGDNWTDTLNVSEAISDALKEGETPAYPTSTNSWGGGGLVPMSSVGELDSAASRMKLFEKASLTATPGGYRLMASRVNNYDTGEEEQDGYVAFDLFIRNVTGTQYIPGLQVLDEEAIYLTVDSEVSVALGGTAEENGVEGTGIENSVRVAFAQIGRVEGTPNVVDKETIQGITCTGGGQVTGICRTAQIWEPNDTRHVNNAISWYENSCVARKAAEEGEENDVTDPNLYEGNCGAVVDGIAKPTYAVKKDIQSSHNVDIYDGAGYNNYTGTSTGENALLESYKYFTDTTKHLRGTSRSAFMTLAPNSITKVRVYIYIEGQDVDNYDFASIGKKISIKFGFTKERFTEDDIIYDGPDVNQGVGPNGEDLTPPVITLKGADGEPTTSDQIEITAGETYSEYGALATDNVDEGPLTVRILGVVNDKVPGVYTITYTATDAAGNMGAKTRTVTVTD